MHGDPTTDEVDQDDEQGLDDDATMARNGASPSATAPSGPLEDEGDGSEELGPRLG